MVRLLSDPFAVVLARDESAREIKPILTRRHSAADRQCRLDHEHLSSHIASMALSRKKATTIALDPEDDRLLFRAARERGVSRSLFIRQHLAPVLEQYRRHPNPRSAVPKCSTTCTIATRCSISRACV